MKKTVWDFFAPIYETTMKSFDLVVIANALHIIPEPQKALAQIKRVLKVGS